MDALSPQASEIAFCLPLFLLLIKHLAAGGYKRQLHEQPLAQAEIGKMSYLSSKKLRGFSQSVWSLRMKMMQREAQ